MIEKISQFIESQGISVRAFEIQIGASNGLIRKAIANETDIQAKWVLAIAENYPQLNLDWLFTGKGPMIRDDQYHLPLEPSASRMIPERDPRDVDRIKHLEELLTAREGMISSLEKTIAAHEKTIARDDQLIAALQQQISDLGGGHISHTKTSGSVPSVDVLLSASKEKHHR